MPIDRVKLIKLLGMTTSQNDGEALNAIRMVNAMLKVNKLDWDATIKGGIVPQPIHKPTPSKPQGRGTTDTAPKSTFTWQSGRYTDPEIPRMLKSLMRDSKGGFRDFVESINEAWENKGYLTEKQYEAIFNAYERAK